MVKKNEHIGSSFDDLLEETGDLAEVSVVAIKRVVASQVSQKWNAKISQKPVCLN